MVGKRIAIAAIVMLLAGANAGPGAAGENASPAANVPTAEDFGALPFLSAPVIAPDGNHLAARTQVDGKPRLLIVDISNDKGARSAIGLPDKTELQSYRWAGNSVLLINVGRTINMLGQPILSTAMFAYDLKTGKTRQVDTGHGIFGDDLMYVDPAGSYILVTAQKSIYVYPSVYYVDLATLTSTEIVKPQDHVWRWFADRSGTVRTGIGSEGGKWWVYYRHDANSPFKRSASRSTLDTANQIDTFEAAPGSDQGYAVASGLSGRFGLYRYDFAADRLGDLIYENPVADLTDFDLSEKGQLESVSFTDDRARTLWFDPALKTLQAKLEKALPGLSIQIVSRSADRSRLVVMATSATNPGTYYMLDRKTGKMMVIAAPFEDLAGKQLSDMQSVSYKARDGLDIPAYLTLPAGRTPKDLPMVVMPHGGPFARDAWGFDTWAQFLASRGYVVLQPNFRGSTGYGRQFVEKGNGQWGRGMQDDIDDGVKWLVARGVVDAKRVCIMGASFGGYAAEWGAVRNPDIYRCAISFAGVSDIGAQLKYDRKALLAPRYFRDWRDRVQGKDGITLDSISPAKRAADLKIPILIAHGDADTNVPPAQSKALVDALTKLGRPPEYYVYKGEGHGFAKPEDQVDFLKKVEAFLTRYNPS
jgi:dipeptidyl aminopeptidase/acylaminoacyl peptidase